MDEKFMADLEAVLKNRHAGLITTEEAIEQAKVLIDNWVKETNADTPAFDDEHDKEYNEFGDIPF